MDCSFTTDHDTVELPNDTVPINITSSSMQVNTSQDALNDTSVQETLSATNEDAVYSDMTETDSLINRYLCTHIFLKKIDFCN